MINQEQPRAIDELVKMNNRTVEKLTRELKKKNEVIKTQTRKIFSLETELKKKTGKLKVNRWLIDGVSSEQLEKEKAQALKESAIEMFVVQLRELSFCDQLSMDGEKLVYMKDVENLLKNMKKQIDRGVYDE